MMTGVGVVGVEWEMFKSPFLSGSLGSCGTRLRDGILSRGVGLDQGEIQAERLSFER